MEPQVNNVNESQIEANKTIEQISATTWFTPLFKVSYTSRILTAFLMIVLPFIGGYVGYKFATGTTSSTSLDNESTYEVISSNATNLVIDSTGNQKIEEDIFVLGDIIRAQRVNEIPGNNRSYDFELILENSHGTTPIAQIGPSVSYFAVSERNNVIAVNLVNAIELIDMHTGVKETIFETRNPNYANLKFSPDESKLAFVSLVNNIFSDNFEVKLHIYDLATRSFIFEKSYPYASSVDGVGVADWPTETNVLIAGAVPKGCADGVFGVVDLDSGEITPVDINGLLDATFWPMKAGQTQIPSACVEVLNMCDSAYESATEITIYSDYTYQTPIDVIRGNAELFIEPIAISPNKQQILYKTYQVENELQCNEPKIVEYRVRSLLDYSDFSVTNYKGLLKDWGVSVVNISNGYDPDRIVVTPHILIKE